MATLIIVHVEPQYDSSEYRLENLAELIQKYADRYYEHWEIINVQTEYDSKNIFYPLREFSTEQWLYGFDAEYYKQDSPGLYIEGKDYIRVSTCHEYAFVDTWLKQLDKKENYVLVGGARHECLQDVYEIMKHLKLKVRINEKLVYAK